MKYQAVIFDLDGTVLDNEDQWSQAFLKVLADLGVTGLKESPHERGIGLKANWARFLDLFQIQTNLSLDELDEATHQAYFGFIDQVQLRSGFEAFARQLKSRGVKLALATSSYRRAADFAIQKFKLNQYFDVVITADDVEATKPNPETFLLAAQKLGVNPKDCLVYEDAESGLAAARTAGMAAIHVTEDYVFSFSML